MDVPWTTMGRLYIRPRDVMETYQMKRLSSTSQEIKDTSCGR